MLKQPEGESKIKTPSEAAAKGGVGVSEELEPLNDREELFCREYICDAAMNATQAYMRVWKGCAYNTARTEASRLLAKPNISLRIDELKEERQKRLEITADRVLSELAKLAFHDPRNFFDEDGRLKPISELDPDHAKVIAGIETMHKVSGDADDGVTITTKIKLADRGQNLERLGRHLKLFTDKQEVTGKDGGAQEHIVATADTPEEFNEFRALFRK